MIVSDPSIKRAAGFDNLPPQNPRGHAHIDASVVAHGLARRAVIDVPRAGEFRYPSRIDLHGTQIVRAVEIRANFLPDAPALDMHDADHHRRRHLVGLRGRQKTGGEDLGRDHGHPCSSSCADAGTSRYMASVASMAMRWLKACHTCVMGTTLPCWAK